LGLFSRLFGRGAPGRRRESEPIDTPYFREGRDAPALEGGPDADPALCEDPGLAARVAEQLEARIRPMLAALGSRCQLVDARRDGTVLLLVGGGCQGCGTPIAAIQDRIERALKAALPEVTAVRAVSPGSSQTIGIDELLG
jgi:Fe-S cluster biogenesis protein NfuA